MSPSVANGRLSTDPVPGTPEWRQERERHDALAGRLAELYRLRARLPDEIRDTEFRLRDSSMRLGLDDDGLAIVPSRRKPRVGLQERTLAALPGPISVVAMRLQEPTNVVGSRLQDYRRRGLCTKDEGYGGAWRRVEP